MSNLAAARESRTIATAHRRLSETYSQGPSREESFWIEPGPDTGGYVLGGEMNSASAEDLTKLTPPPGAMDVTLDLSAVTCFDTGAMRAIEELASRIDRDLVIARPSQAVRAGLASGAAGELPGIVVTDQ